jgi:hypothetical protein
MAIRRVIQWLAIAVALAPTLSVTPVLGDPIISGDPITSRATADDKHPTPVLTTATGVVTGTGITFGGNVTQLWARSTDSVPPPPGDVSEIIKPPPVMPYLVGGLGAGLYSAGPTTVAGPSFTPSATAKITISTIAAAGTTPAKASWIADSVVAIVPTTPPPTPPPPAETARAFARVTDPIVVSNVPQDAAQATFTLEIGTDASLLIDPDLGPGEAASASYSGFDTTTLNGIGTLWNWSWSADSINSGESTFSFVSNSALGLDDSAIDSIFDSLVSYDPSTGEFSLTAPFDVNATVDLLPNQSSFTYGGESEVDADASIPEPPSLALLGAGLVGFGMLRRFKAARKS